MSTTRHPQSLQVDNIIVCAGQESGDTMYQQLTGSIENLHLIVGAELATEIDANEQLIKAPA